MLVFEELFPTAAGCTIPPATYKGSNFSTSSATFIFHLVIIAILMSVKFYLTVILICIFLITSDVEHLFVCLLAIVSWVVFLSVVEL